MNRKTKRLQRFGPSVLETLRRHSVSLRENPTHSVCGTWNGGGGILAWARNQEGVAAISAVMNAHGGITYVKEV